MGLDMYLTRKVYVGAEYEHRGVVAKISVKVGNRKLKIDPTKITYIEEKAGYWRKANQIHSWFVNNVQDGEDNCNPHWVSKAQMEELLEICNKILNSTKLVDGKVWNGQRSTPSGKWEDIWEDGKIMENPMLAQEYLPTESGFFFGSEKYDENYWQDLLDTVEILKNALDSYDGDSEFYYCSSW